MGGGPKRATEDPQWNEGKGKLVTFTQKGGLGGDQ